MQPAHRIHWSTEEVREVLLEAARLQREFESRDMAKLIARAQLVLPPGRRRPTHEKGGLPAISGLNARRIEYSEGIRAILAEQARDLKPAHAPQAPPPPAPEPPPHRISDTLPYGGEARDAPTPFVTSVHDELANYGLADLLAATVVRLLDAWREAAPMVQPATQATAPSQPPSPSAKLPYVTHGDAPRSRKVRIAGIGYLPAQQAAIQNRIPEVDFTWIDADQSQTYVPPSMDFAIISRFCHHRWSEHCWRMLGQARAPRVTGGISEAAQTVRMLLSRQGVNGAKG